ncbi:MAG TPA: lipase maturation factor family protein [Vicinamibacterales bacterium]|nr:lipase maturation factor family protein [Vicinamibacterales bacterium]
MNLLADDYQIARFLIERGLGLIYFSAFVVAFVQFPALAGERGLDPAPQFLRHVRFRDAPSLFQWRYSDRLLRIIAAIGAALSAAVVVGLVAAAPLIVTMSVWVVLWFLYLSIMKIGGTFYGFGWESQLVETGFVAIFLGNAQTTPPFVTMLLFLWIGFRVEFGAGLIKLRGDECWRKLTCMDYHHETQPLPNPLSWFAHRAPQVWHRVEAVGNFVAQLVLPFGLFLPQPIASLAAVLMIATQLYLVVSGNYSWLNWITIVALVAGISDSSIRMLIPALAPATVAPTTDTPTWFVAATVGFAIVVAVLSYWPVRNLLSRRQAMNRSFNPWHLVNTYGAFGSVTRTRYEVVVEGTESQALGEDTEWREYEFKAKPGDPRRLPPQIAPYHLRLDWLMWFIPISPAYAGEWFIRFLYRLLEADRPTLRLLRRDPFDGRRPAYVRARLFHYRFATFHELRETGAWWVRRPVSDLVPAIRLGAS